MQQHKKIQDESEFPVMGTAAEKLHFMLQYAILAPSLRNSQPWQFRIVDDTVELYADRSRALNVVDPQHRELLISCGTALEHLAIAMQHFGRVPKLEYFPNPDDPDFLARVRLGAERAGNTEDAMLFYAIHRRQTNRGKFSDREITSEMFSNLVTSSVTSDVWLEMLDGPTRRGQVADLIAEADIIQGRNPEFRTELAQWFSGAHAGRDDGMTREALGLSYIGAIIESLRLRKSDLGARRAKHHRKLIGQSRLLAVLGTIDDDPPAWLYAGQSLARLLLRARSSGVHASFFSQPVQIPEIRAKLAAVAGGHGFPQIVLRMGYSSGHGGETPRRDIAKVLRK